MNDPTPEEVRASIIPKSDQLNADDLITGPITVAITKVRAGDKEQPIVIDIEGHRPYKPCKSMRRVLIAAFSDEARAWVGQRMTLYCDPSVTWAGVKVGGIRISHLSIDAPKTFLLTKARGKREEVTILPLPKISDMDAAYIDEVKREIALADTPEKLKAIGFILRETSKGVQDAVRGVYAARQKELES